MYLLPALPCMIVALLAATTVGADSWRRHTIDATSRGADGVRLADVDGDGRLDVATGWEEGGLVRVYRHPDTDQVRQPWPSVTVGSVTSPEDAVIVDVDQDGAIDVVSCCEGKTRTVYWHRAPADVDRYWDAAAWTTQTLTSGDQSQSWMFCLPLEATTRQSTLIIGSKGNAATISRLTMVAGNGAVSIDPRATTSIRSLCGAGWIMSLCGVDMDGDGDRDILFSDRKGPRRGVAWLEQPANPAQGDWLRHDLGGGDHEVMFLDTADLTSDGVDEVVAATRSAGPIVFQCNSPGDPWTELMIPMPADCGTGKGIAIVDVDQNGRVDLVISCENAENKHGVFWLSARTLDINGPWKMHPISGRREGIKFDRLETLDLDADGDLDVLTCEERDNLGVIWYENPTR